MEHIVQKNNWHDIAGYIVDFLSTKTNDRATILTLSGDLGAGKTTLTQDIATHLGIKDKINSPTFVIMKKYEINNSNFKNLIHIDAYRLKDEDELNVLGWDKIIKEKDNLIIIEWPENISISLPDSVSKVCIDHIDDNSRKVKIML